LLAAGWATALEYLSRIYSGLNNSTDNVLAYTTEFLVPFNSRYSEVGVLLWSSLRNGIIHGAWPQSVALENAIDKRIGIGVSVTPSDPHLEVVTQNGRNFFGVNAIQLFDDLVRSVNYGFVPWIERLGDATNILDRAGPKVYIIREGNVEGVRGFRFINGLRNAAGNTG